MAADTKQNIKTLMVENWAVFFLQRLQLMFAKGDACDLTLKFHTGQELKVHRLVLITCTTFFENLAKDGDSIFMPEEFPYTAVQPIINFLYSGKLDFKPELHQKLLSIAKSLDITILAKLLITQKNDNGMGILVKNDDKKTQRTFLATRIGTNPNKNVLSGKKLPIWRQRSYPFFKPPERRIIKEEEPKPRRFEWPEGKEPRDVVVLTTPSFTPLSFESEQVFTSLAPLMKTSTRNYSFSKDNISSTSLIPSKRPASTPVPLPEKLFKVARKELVSEINKDDTHTEAADFSDDDDGHFETIHSFGDSDDDQDTETPVDGVSQKATQPETPAPTEPEEESCASLLTTPIRSYSSAAVAQQNTQPISPNRPVCATNVVGQSDTPTEITLSQAIALAPVTPTAMSSQSLPTTPKPILKPITESSGHTTAKKVRFSLINERKDLSVDVPGDERSSNKEEGSSREHESDVSSTVVKVTPPTHTALVETPTTSSDSTSAGDQASSTAISDTPSDDEPIADVNNPSPSGSTPPKSSTPTTYSTKTPKTLQKVSPTAATNHAKIIAEVLKKYPELVRNNKNIRLKISSPGTTNVTNLLTLDTKKTEGNSSYMVVKSYVKTEGVVKSSGTPFALAPSTSNSQSKASTFNSDRPWLCSICNKPDSPKVFENYRDYRIHMTQVHDTKVDPKTCEHCGYRTAKRNLLLYHLFTKHKMNPPKNITFPKCDLCGYVAMSETLLQRHVLTHKCLTDWPCPKCKILFKSSQSLRVHLFSCRKEPVVFTCAYCSVKFNSNIQFNEHSDVCTANPNHKLKQSPASPAPLPPPLEPSTPPPLPLPPTVNQIYETGNSDTSSQEQNVEMIEVPILDSDSIAAKEHTFIQLPNGLILVPAQPQQLQRADSQRLDAVGNEVALIRNGGSTLDQMTVNQNITLLSSDGGPPGRNSVAGQMGLAMGLPQDQHVILLDANSEFFIQGNDSVVVTQLNDASDEYIVPEVMDEGMRELYSAQTVQYSVATSAASMVTSSGIPLANSEGDTDEQPAKLEDCGSTVVRVQNSSELDSVQMQHPDEMDTIIVHDVPQSSADEQHHLYAEEPALPPRQHMTINKELMEVVAMEVQRSPSFLENTNVMIPEVPQTHHTVLRQSSSGIQPTMMKQRAVSSPAISHNVYHRMETRKDVDVLADSIADGEMVIEEESNVSDDIQTERAAESEALGDDVPIKEDYDSEEERAAQQTAAKADSFVKDWGFDNEEESDVADLACDESDDENNDGDKRIGPSRVTVEL